MLLLGFLPSLGLLNLWLTLLLWLFILGLSLLLTLGFLNLRLFFFAVLSVADVAEPRASVDTAVAIVVLVPVSVVVAGVYSSGRPRFLAFPNGDLFPSSSSPVEVVGEESVHSSTGARTNHGFYSILSNPGPRQNRNLGHDHNNPMPGHNSVSDTIGLAKDATTNHRGKRCLRLNQGQRRHKYPGSRSPPVGPQIRWVVAEKFQY